MYNLYTGNLLNKLFREFMYSLYTGNLLNSLFREFMYSLYIGNLLNILFREFMYSLYTGNLPDDVEARTSVYSISKLLGVQHGRIKKKTLNVFVWSKH